MGKIIQIATMTNGWSDQDGGRTYNYLFALTEDGKIWRQDRPDYSNQVVWQEVTPPETR